MKDGKFDGIRQAPDEGDEEAEKREWLRDMFASHALTGILANKEGGRYFETQSAAFRSYEFADAMLVARGEK